MTDPSRTAPLSPHLRVAAAVAALAVLVRAAPPGAVAADLAALALGPQAPTTDTALVAVLAALGYLVAGWLLLVVAAVALAATGGGLGRAGSAALRVVAPVAVRRAVSVALGVSVLSGVGCTAGPAAAAEPAPPAPGVAVTNGLDWPLTPPGRVAAPGQLVVPADRGSPAAEVAVTVRPGDSLWRLAERRLVARSGDADVTDREVAAAWPRWWSANRDVVGPDPDLLHPGAVLVPPPA